MNAKVAQPLNRLIILSLVAAISACVAPTRKTSGPAAGESSASLYILEGTARYAELEQKALQNLNTPSEHTTSNIAPLCVALSNLKKYRQLFQCLNELQSRVQRGDVTIRSDLFLLGLVDLSSDASAMPDALRGEALIDLGQYAESIKAGEAAWPAIKDTNSQGIWPPDRYRIMILSNLAHASALSGNREQVDECTCFGALNVVEGLCSLMRLDQM